MLTPGKRILSGLVPSFIWALALAGCAGAPSHTNAAQVAAEAAVARAPLSLDEVVALSKQGVSPEALITRIDASGARYRLSAADVISLNERGVPLRVIDYLLAPDRYPPVGKAEEPAQRVQPAPNARPIPALYLGL